MLKTCAGALAVLLCAVVLGACGATTATTTAVTVPSGKLNTAGYCMVPPELRSGRRINITGIRAVGTDCPAAVALATIYASSQRFPLGHTCSVTRSSGGAHAMCLNDKRVGAYFSWTDGPAAH